MTDLFSAGNKSETVDSLHARQWLEHRIRLGVDRNGYAEVGILNPPLAKMLLERNVKNRRINIRNLESLKADAAMGRFQWNGESIVISDTGVLLDGQHRCEMVASANTQVKAVFVFGPEERTRETIDSGKRRSVADQLGIKGKKNKGTLASATTMYAQYSSIGRLDKDRVATQYEIVTLAESLPDLGRSVEYVCGMTTRYTGLGGPAVIAFCHYVFARHSGWDMADRFVSKLIEGDGLFKGDAIYCCRQKLASMHRGHVANVRACVIFRCWNAWRLGQTITKMNITDPSLLPALEK